MIIKLSNLIAQERNAVEWARKFSACCARCARPMTGDERLVVGRFTYGECCMLDVQTKPGGQLGAK